MLSWLSERASFGCVDREAFDEVLAPSILILPFWASLKTIHPQAKKAWAAQYTSVLAAWIFPIIIHHLARTFARTYTRLTHLFFILPFGADALLNTHAGSPRPCCTSPALAPLHCLLPLLGRCFGSFTDLAHDEAHLPHVPHVAHSRILCSKNVRDV